VPNLRTYLGRVLVVEEQLKEELRQRFVQALDVDELLTDPARVAAELLDVVLQFAREHYIEMEKWGYSLAKTINGGQDVVQAAGVATDDGLSKLADSVGTELSHFLIDFEATASRMLDSGMAKEQVKQNLAAGLDPLRLSPLFSGLVSGITGAVAAGVQYTANTAMMQSVAATPGQPNPPDSEWVWVTVQDNRRCEDCAPRHNQIKSLLEWEQEGLPKSGWSRCDERCRCMIMPSVFADEEYDRLEPLTLDYNAVVEIGKRAAEAAMRR
jgi:hypothetical protein